MLTPETRESNMTVQILLSTYNGQRFLDDQLKSIISQTIKDRGLLIRDDGSTDQTCDILKCFQQKYSWIHFYHGSNIGVQKSYLDLIRESDRQADYTVFSDQDDIWLPTKIERALQCLKQLEEDSPKGIPLLYCSNTTPVDEGIAHGNTACSEKNLLWECADSERMYWMHSRRKSCSDGLVERSSARGVRETYHA